MKVLLLLGFWSLCFYGLGKLASAYLDRRLASAHAALAAAEARKAAATAALHKVLEKCACPGDTDLDFDVTGLCLVNVLRYDRDFIITFCGGAGRGWSYETEGMVDASPAEGEAIFSYKDDAPVDLIETINERLEHWRVDRTPLRLVMAPGRLSALAEQDGQNKQPLLLPRTGP